MTQDDFKEKVLNGFYSNHPQGSELFDIDLDSLIHHEDEITSTLPGIGHSNNKETKETKND